MNFKKIEKIFQYEFHYIGSVIITMTTVYKLTTSCNNNNPNNNCKKHDCEKTPSKIQRKKRLGNHSPPPKCSIVDVSAGCMGPVNFATNAHFTDEAKKAAKEEREKSFAAFMEKHSSKRRRVNSMYEPTAVGGSSASGGRGLSLGLGFFGSDGPVTGNII